VCSPPEELQCYFLTPPPFVTESVTCARRALVSQVSTIVNTTLVVLCQLLTVLDCSYAGIPDDGLYIEPTQDAG
jgi:hypothetical protein